MACSNGLLDYAYMYAMTVYAARIKNHMGCLYVIVLYLSEKDMMSTEDIKLLLEIVRNSPILEKSALVYRSMPEKNHLKTLGPWIQEKTGQVNFNISFSTVKGIALEFAEKGEHFPICCLESYCVQPGVPVFSPMYLAHHLAEEWKRIQKYAIENGKYPLPDRRSSDTDILRTLDADQEVMITDAHIEAGDYYMDESDSHRVLTRKGYLNPAPKRNIHFETTRHYVKPTPTPIVGDRKKISKKISNKSIERDGA
jgi:hypothetical protein